MKYLSLAILAICLCIHTSCKKSFDDFRDRFQSKENRESSVNYISKEAKLFWDSFESGRRKQR